MKICHRGTIFGSDPWAIKVGEVMKTGTSYYLKVGRDIFMNLRTYDLRGIGEFHGKKVYLCPDIVLMARK